MQQNLISIFIPVYNGEKYLEKTLLSIKNQSYSYFEVLLVDDSSSDGSLAILTKFATQDIRFQVFEKQNGGMSATSWNYILPKVKGEFMFYASQDDLFSENLLAEMLKTQQLTNADSVLPDMEYYFENSTSNTKIIGLNGNRAALLSGREACRESLDWTIHGFSLTKTRLFQNEIFPEDAFDSDEFITRKILFNSNKVAFSKGTFFYRQDNNQAITKKFGKKDFYTPNTLLKMYDFLEEHNFAKNDIVIAQYQLYIRVLDMFALHELYQFETNNYKKQVGQFLKNFKQNNIVVFSLFSNLKFTSGRLYIKFWILFLLFKYPILFKVGVIFKRLQFQFGFSKKYRFR